MGTYVVTGATGRVGSVVARELLVRGETPRVIVRTDAAAREWRDLGAHIARGSLDDAMFLADALRGADGLFTLLPENVPPDDFHGARRRMADAIAEAVTASGAPHVVLLSAIAAVLPNGNGPAKDLHYCENRLRRSGAPTTVLRACYFQDNVASVLPAAMHAGIYPNLLGSSEIAFPMIATRDVGRLAADALIGPAANETIDLFGPAYSIRQVADRLGAALGRPLQVVDVPPHEHVPSLVRAGVPQPLAEVLAEMFAAFAEGKIVPAGDRSLAGTTPIDDVIGECLARAQS